MLKAGLLHSQDVVDALFVELAERPEIQEDPVYLPHRAHFLNYIVKERRKVLEGESRRVYLLLMAGLLNILVLVIVGISFQGMAAIERVNFGEALILNPVFPLAVFALPVLVIGLYWQNVMRKRKTKAQNQLASKFVELLEERRRLQVFQREIK